MNIPFKIIDISQPITRDTACFPGDTAFDFKVTSAFTDNGCFNLTSFQMSPHIGTHTDAPGHVLKNMEQKNLAGALPLDPFVGPCSVIDVSPYRTEITPNLLKGKLENRTIQPRVLLRTKTTCSYNVFAHQSAYLSPEIFDLFHRHGIKLIGIDTPSVDATQSKSLDTHHALISYNMMWLENLDLSAVQEGDYFLVALPLKLMELEAAPVRAVLLSFNKEELHVNALS